MFWNRKGKKKDGGETGGSGAASSTVTTESAADEEPEAARGADDEGAEKAEKKAPAVSPADSADTTADDDAAEQKADTADEDTPEKEKPGEAESAKDEAEAEKADKDESEADKGEPGDDTAAEGKADADSKAGEGDADDGATDDADTGEAASAGDNDDADDNKSDDKADEAASADTDDDASDDDAEEDADEETAAPEPDVPGVGKVDDEGVQRVRTAGVLTVDGEEFDVVTSTWIVDADKEGVIVIDPANDAEAILEAIGDREVYLVACTNAYNTHISAAIEVAERDEAPIALHRRELRAWRRVHGAEHRPDLEIEGGGSLSAGDLEIDILPIPGTSAGSVAYYIPERGVVFTGDSLRAGELGTVGGAYIDYTRQLHSIGEVVLSLQPETRVLPDSGPETTVEAESKNFDSWVAAD
ncbi:MBL fold metallo-hydrolase [Nocardiopsis sediminis]|uniref:MBL fold metallo-hydrolase n=1 Tax=Nocardiopsis sediminis TaxID=1778267 RepID=A0ABV8FP77_9ACTN